MASEAQPAFARRPPVTQAPVEVEAGITEYIYPSLAGFACRFKELWQDFQVYEIDRSGIELHLSELITPGAVSAELKAASAARREARAALGPSFAPEPVVAEEVCAALGPEPAEELWSFLRRQRPRNDSQLQEAASEPQPAQETEAPPAFVDLDAEAIGNGSKEARKRAHRAILDHFGSLLNTETVEADGGSRRLRVWMRDAELKAKAPIGGSDTQVGGGGKDSGKDKGKSRTKGKDKGRGKGKKGRNRGAQDDSMADSGGAAEFGTFRREGWPKDRPDYLHFRLYKENIDTAEAVANIAKCVGRSVKTFNFAGTKDRRASTVQQVSAYRLPADQLRRTLTHRLWDKRLRISDLTYKAERLRLGYLQGNCFHVALRGVPATAAIATDGAESSDLDRSFAGVKSKGFLNYFGLQRFGSRKIRTHHVGAAILARQWERAVRLIVGDEASIPAGALRKRLADSTEEIVGDSCESDGIPPAKRARTTSDETACKIDDDSCKGDSTGDSSAKPNGTADASKRPKWQLIEDAKRLFLSEGDAQAALEAMPRNQHLERCVLGALARNLSPADTLRQLPHQALALYVHAAQGLVWNAVLSRRVRDFGAKPVVGDLVLAGDGSSAGFAASKERTELPETATDNGTADDAAATEMICLSGEDGGEDVMEEDEGMLPAVRVLQTPEEAAEVEFSDLVLPLPGSEVQYPSHLKAMYESVARDLLGVSLSDFHDSTLVPLRGAYRHVAVRPGSLEWRVLSARELQAAGSKRPLMQSDVARLLATRGPVPGPESEALDVPCPTSSKDACTATSSEAQTGIDTEPGQALNQAPEPRDEAAVVFSCSLPPSAYLTMLLREVSKHVVE